MKKTFLPFCAARIVVLGQKTTFYIGDNKVVVETPRKLMSQLVTLCNGKRPIDQIINLLKNRWDEESSRSLVSDLRRRNILIDGSAAGEAAWELVENPIGFPLFLSEEDKMRLVEKAKQRTEGVRTTKNIKLHRLCMEISSETEGLSVHSLVKRRSRV